LVPIAAGPPPQIPDRALRCAQPESCKGRK
jgi:hypothetical protein